MRGRGVASRMAVFGWLVWGTVVMLAVSSVPAGAVGDLLEELPPRLIEHIRENRPVDPDPEEVRNAFREHLYPYELEQEGDAWQRVLRKPHQSATSRQEALQDIDILFELLKYGYAGYQLFGGDATFSKARELLEEDVARVGEPIPHLALSSFISNQLSFVQDGHFSIDGRSPLFASPRDRSTYLTNLQYEVRPANDELLLYHVREDHGILGTLVAVNDGPPDAYLKPSVNREGEFVYHFGIVSDETVVRLDLLFEADGDEHTRQVGLTQFDRRHQRPQAELYTVKEQEGIRVAVCRALATGDLCDEEQLDNFVDDAPALGEEPCLILDLRSNRGGSLRYVYEWLDAFVRAYNSQDSTPSGVLYAEDPIAGDLTRSVLTAHLRTRTALALQESRANDVEGVPVTGNSVHAGWTIPKYQPLANTMPNDTVLVVLIDPYTTSAGEWFVSALWRMENVIIIGYPTRGVLTTGRTVRVALPNSGIAVALPQSIRMEPNLDLREGRGVAPDLWVEPRRAVETAARFLHKYFDCGE